MREIRSIPPVMEAITPQTSSRVDTPRPFTERRSSPRLPTPELSVAIERPTGSELCVADALDISGDGLGLVLSYEFPPGTEVLLTFQLGETRPFVRVPAVVIRQGLGTGALQLRGCPEAERRRLLSYILEHTPRPV